MEASPPASACETTAPGKHWGIPGSSCLPACSGAPQGAAPLPHPLHLGWASPDPPALHPQSSPAAPQNHTCTPTPLCTPVPVPAPDLCQLSPPPPALALHLHPPNSPLPHSCTSLRCPPVSPLTARRLRAPRAAHRAARAEPSPPRPIASAPGRSEPGGSEHGGSEQGGSEHGGSALGGSALGGSAPRAAGTAFGSARLNSAPLG